MIVVGGLRSPRGLSLLAMLGALVVVGVFFAMTAVAQHSAQQIDRLAASLANTALPSIDHLTRARGALRESGVAAARLVRDKAAEQARAREVLTDASKLINSEMAMYGDLPAYTGERAKAQEAQLNLGFYEKLVERLLRLVAAGDLEHARRLLAEEITPAAERFDDDLERLVQIDAGAGITTSHEIARLRSRTARLSYLLHGVAGALALLVLGVVARVGRSYERIAEERARIESERKQLAEQRAAELDMFAARVAHDLKNPLSALALSVTFADMHAAEPAQVHKSLERASRAIGNMRAIIEGLLALARSETPVGACANLRDAIERAVADLAPALERAEAVLDVAPVGEIKVACTEGALLSVVGNLLGNAAKFLTAAPSGRRRIAIRVSEKIHSVCVEIEDSGPGIPPEKHAAIFEPYVRGKDLRQPGLGLGLATVKRIIEAHGGAVGLRSVVGEGSCFWFELPRLSG